MCLFRFKITYHDVHIVAHKEGAWRVLFGGVSGPRFSFFFFKFNKNQFSFYFACSKNVELDLSFVGSRFVPLEKRERAQMAILSDKILDRDFDHVEWI